MNNLPGYTNIPLDALLADPKFAVKLTTAKCVPHAFAPAVEHLWTATPQRMALYHLHQVAKGERV